MGGSRHVAWAIMDQGKKKKEREKAYSVMGVIIYLYSIHVENRCDFGGSIVQMLVHTILAPLPVFWATFADSDIIILKLF